MKREAITMDGCGRIAVPSDTTNVWMSEMELVELFDVIAPTLHAAIRRVQERSVATLRSGKARQTVQRLLYGRVRPANGRGTCFPHQHAQRCKGAQCPVGKAVLAKRKASAMHIVK